MSRLQDWNGTATIPPHLNERLTSGQPIPNVEDGDVHSFVHAVIYHGSAWMERSYQVQDFSLPRRWWWVFPYLDGSGYLVRSSWESQVAGPGHWVSEVKTYARCDHDITSKTVGNCYHRHTCAKCGLVFHIDSGD